MSGTECYFRLPALPVNLPTLPDPIAAGDPVSWPTAEANQSDSNKEKRTEILTTETGGTFTEGGTCVEVEEKERLPRNSQDIKKRETLKGFPSLYKESRTVDMNKLRMTGFEC
ncbi:MAG: hypothetical protein LIP00_06015, partial [Parabacteroides sp.]|nr:hypothetical protein [Parabacteroides sp.]